MGEKKKNSAGKNNFPFAENDNNIGRKEAKRLSTIVIPKLQMSDLTL